MSKMRTLYDKFKNLHGYLSFYKMCLKSPEVKRILSENKKFKNIHCGKRCFILGNGPSLKSEDLSVLENEYVFSVNQFARNPYLEKVKPAYHFWADQNFFNIDTKNSGDMELLKVMKNINTKDNKPQCFFPLEQKDFVEKFKLDEELKINYFYSNIRMYDGYKKNIDFTSTTPAFSTVVQWCVSMAIYMGFSEIYILGCDNTSLMVNFKTVLDVNNEDDYVYELSENEKQRMKKMVSAQSLENHIYSCLGTFREYRYLNQYCEKRGIKFVNLSSRTVLDCVPRDNFKKIINGR